MSLCRNYPTPSNRMGVMWSLIPLKNSVVLEYGPAGTTHFGAGFYSSLGIDIENTLFTTHISEDDIIMGDVSRLEKAIIEIDETYNPKVIFIVASAVIAVIGTDIKGVCQYMQEKVKAKLICFDDGGFGGDYTIGLENTYTILVKEFVSNKSSKNIKKYYNILGASFSSYRIKSDVWEIKDLMKRAFDMDCNIVLGLEENIENLSKLSEVSFNIVLRKEALPAAKYLEKEFNIPFIYQVPYGYQATLDWIHDISNILNLNVSEEVNNQLEEKIKDLNMEINMSRMMFGNLYKFQPTATIIGDYDTIIGVERLCDEFDIKVENKICNHSLKNIKELDGIINYKKEKEKNDLLKTLNKQIIFGDEVSLNLCNNTNTKICISFPFPNKRQVATHLPFVGERGADFLTEIIRGYLASLR